MCYDYTHHDYFDDVASRDEQADSFEPYSVIEAEYAPPSSVPDWASVFIGVRSLWLVDGDTAHMAPYRSACASQTTLWVPLKHLRSIVLAGSLLDDLH